MIRTWAVIAALLLGGCFGVTTDSRAPVDLSAPGRWTTAAAMPSPRQEVAVATFAGHVWVIGGLGAGAAPVSTVERYDPASNTWDARPRLPVPVHHAAAVVVGDRLYVLGGYTGGRIQWQPLDSVYEWSEARATWEARVPMPTPRGALAAVELNGRIHALGGSAGDALSAHEVYDPTTSRWTVVNPMPTARDHLAAVVFASRIWALGGRASFMGTQYANVEVYDAATDSWRTGPPLPRARGGLAAAALPGRILVFGGESPFRIFNATEMYEPGGNRWIAKEPMPTPRHGMGAVVVDGRVYVTGGGTEPGLAPSQANEVYAP